MILTLGCEGSAPPPAQAVGAGLPLRGDGPRLDFGTVQQASQHTKKLTLRNHSSLPALVDRLQVSCDCLAANPAAFRLAPGGTQELTLKLDLAREPHFTGQMRLDVEGFAGPTRVFHVEAHPFYGCMIAMPSVYDTDCTPVN